MGLGVRAISRELGRSPSTISRELKRGQCRQFLSVNGVEKYVEVYSDEASSIKAIKDHARRGAKLKLVDCPCVLLEIERLIKCENYSPAAALYEVREQNLLDRDVSIGTIYNYIRRGFTSVSSVDMPYNKTAYEKKARVKRKSQKHQFLKLHGMSIENRPIEIDYRLQFGHWEGDLIVGTKRSKACLLTLTERITRFEVALKISNRTCMAVAEALDNIEEAYGELFKEVFRSITFDNGGEFADYDLLTRCKARDKPRFQIYYAHPYSSYERGLNENTNRMLRRKFPKGTNFDYVSREDVAQSVKWVNNYPRDITKHTAWRARDFFGYYINAIKTAA